VPFRRGVAVGGEWRATFAPWRIDRRVSQQSAVESRSTERRNGLSFPSLVDRGGKVARSFGLRWKLSRELRAAEIESTLDLAIVNGESS